MKGKNTFEILLTRFWAFREVSAVIWLYFRRIHSFYFCLPIASKINTSKWFVNGHFRCDWVFVFSEYLRFRVASQTAPANVFDGNGREMPTVMNRSFSTQTEKERQSHEETINLKARHFVVAHTTFASFILIHSLNLLRNTSHRTTDSSFSCTVFGTSFLADAHKLKCIALNTWISSMHFIPDMAFIYTNTQRKRQNCQDRNRAKWY